MKKLLLFSLLICSLFTFGQKVKLKKEIVYIDDKECLRYASKNLGNNNIFSSIDGTKLFFMDLVDESSVGSSNDKAYIKISFLGSDFIATMPNTYSRKELIEGMIEVGLIENCVFNKDRIADFIKRYDQHYENSIIRHSY